MIARSLDDVTDRGSPRPRRDRGRALRGFGCDRMRSGVFGFTNVVPGRCRPMISMSIWFEFAVRKTCRYLTR
jgi:hypothetical protein